MINPIIIVERRYEYGRELIYPKTYAKELKQLTGRKTLTAHDFKALRDMGYDFKVKDKYQTSILD